MVLLTTKQMLLVGVIGGYTALLLHTALRLVWRGLNRAAEWFLDGHGHRRALRRGRRQLRNLNTIDDLKE